MPPNDEQDESEDEFMQDDDEDGDRYMVMTLNL